MTIENYTGSEGKRTSRPAGKNAEFIITPIVWTQVLILNKDKNKEESTLVAEKGKTVESPLSTELAEGQSIKTYNDIVEKSQEDDYTK